MPAGTDKLDFDWLIVGSGFGGSVSACRLVEKGYKVGILEAGRRFRSNDFPDTNYALRDYLFAPSLGCFGIQRLTLLSDVMVLSGAGVGGGSLVYANTLLIPTDETFKNSGWLPGRDWREVLRPHYQTVLRMLGAAEVPEDFPADLAIKRAAEKLGRGASFRRQQVGVYFGQSGKEVDDPYFGGKGPKRTGCTFCGGCMVGCRFGAKNTLDKNYLYFAEAGGARVIPSTLAIGISEIPGGGYAVETRPTDGSDDRTVFRARRVILSAGVLGTMRLLMESRRRGTLARLSRMLGKKVSTNNEAIIGATARNANIDYSRGVAIGSSVHISADTHVEAVRYSAGSSALSILATLLTDGGSGAPRQLRFLDEIVRHPTDFARSFDKRKWAERTVILLCMQSKESELELDLGHPWYWPFSRTIVSRRSQRGVRIPTYIPEANAFARKVAEVIDGIPTSALNEVLLDVPTTAHILGGAPMGRTPDDGLIDDHHQVFGHEGLYVIDGSSVPSNLGVNPSLTISAMAEYAMSQIATRTDAAWGPV
ncbi:MAG: GMC family oxidoreductase [Deltaproteobacteria bacterium]|nr:GMC family oxidoreductase [Deltaproteobacteria bacterium]